MVRKVSLCAAALLVALATTGAGTAARAAGPGPNDLRPIGPVKAPKYRAGDFVDKVDNPWFPLVPGAKYVYAGRDGRHKVRDVLTVARKTKVIDGVRCAVVHDDVYTDGRLSEPTVDYYAQDKDGNVWYFGEDTAEFDRHGRVETRSGSWRAGEHHAHAGIYMPAHPKVGQEFQQEYRTGVAEDRFRVTDTSGNVKVPAAPHAVALVTLEWSPLEPRTYERKYYVQGVGNVAERTVRGGAESQRLVSYETPRA